MPCKIVLSRFEILVDSYELVKTDEIVRVKSELGIFDKNSVSVHIGHVSTVMSPIPANTTVSRSDRQEDFDE